MVLIVLALIVCAYMAWNIGANDVANAMGTSVGSRALTLKQAVVIAAVFEFCGAFFAGDAVTDTVRKGILSVDFSDPMVDAAFSQDIAFGFIAAMMAASGEELYSSNWQERMRQLRLMRQRFSLDSSSQDLRQDSRLSSSVAAASTAAVPDASA